MNTRITCLLLFVIAHASATAAPKFPLTLKAGIDFFSNGEFRENNLEVTSLDWSSDGKLLLSNGIKTVYKGKRKDSERHLAIWDAITWDEAKKIQGSNSCDPTPALNLSTQKTITGLQSPRRKGLVL